MSSTLPNEKFEKYEALLNLALAQIDAIDAGDQKSLDRIIDRKWTIISGLSGTKELLKSEPALGPIIEQIQTADALAEKKLTERMSTVRNKLCLLNKHTTAKHAYSQMARKSNPIMGLAIDSNTPRFFDIHS